MKRWKQLGGGWVLAQLALFAVYAASHWAVPSRWSRGSASLLLGGALLTSMGVLAGLLSVHALRRSLTPFPTVRPDAKLVTSDPFRVVRHPIYGSIIISLVGISTMTAHWPSFAIIVVLALFFRMKSQYEEEQLRLHFEMYETYARRTRWRILPGF